MYHLLRFLLEFSLSKDYTTKDQTSSAEEIGPQAGVFLGFLLSFGVFGQVRQAYVLIQD